MLDSLGMGQLDVRSVELQVVKVPPGEHKESQNTTSSPSEATWPRITPLPPRLVNRNVMAQDKSVLQSRE